MSLIAKIFGGSEAVTALGSTAQGVAEVFTPNATRKMELNHEAQQSALSQLETEMKTIRDDWFDSFVNGLNRLPRPLLALGTLGLFVYAMMDPIAFAQRMAGLAYIPDPLWWLLGAIVSFYFGAREMHYFRNPLRAGVAAHETVISAWRNSKKAVKTEVKDVGSEAEGNPALSAWRADQE